MEQNDLLEPELLYKRELKEKHHKNVTDLFDELVKQSGVDPEANKALCEKIYAKQSETKKVEISLGKSRTLKGFSIAMIVIARTAMITISTILMTGKLAVIQSGYVPSSNNPNIKKSST